MATLTVQTPAAAGATLTLVAAAAGGDQFPNNGREMLVVTNGGGSPITVSFAGKVPCDFGATHNAGPHSVTNGTTKYFPALDPNRFNNDSGRVEVTYSGVVSVTVGVIKGA